MGLIAGELDLDIPSIPFSAIDEFVQRTKEIHFSSPTLSNEETVYFQRNNRVYPWDRRLLEYQGQEFYNYTTQEPFNKLVDIINCLPIKKDTRVVLLLCQNTQHDYDFNFHFDRDSKYGFRICIGLTVGKPFLELAELKQEYLTNNLNKIDNNMVEDLIHTIYPTKSNTLFCIPGYKYPHRVPITNSVQRCSIIVRGELTQQVDTLKFLNRIDE
jgi:hypothetical protein